MFANGTISLAFLNKLIYKMNVFLIKLPMEFLWKGEADCESPREDQGEPRIAKIMLKRVKWGGFMVLGSKTHCYWDDACDLGTELYQQTDPHTYVLGWHKLVRKEGTNK